MSDDHSPTGHVSNAERKRRAAAAHNAAYESAKKAEPVKVAKKRLAQLQAAVALFVSGANR